MNIKVKFCGITRYEDAKIAVNLGANALGFIFYPSSPRYVHPAQALKIIKQLPPFISKVGVFVNEEIDTVRRIVKEFGIDAVQLHGSETPEYCNSLCTVPVIKSFSVQPDSDVTPLSNYDVSAFLLDTWDPECHGGSGKTFDWSIAKNACNCYQNVILAGGLGPSNIAEAVLAVEPYAVDVNSGVEISPGVKNPVKMREVMKTIRSLKGS
ncbi:phosphoribosylanthranilate isomerase [Chitinispirillales bacterium ANBcel5]|uniref:phosphoribosylanthranilate isomerase n=1 Tax=Cellulosispirillum alkaliphilum TaxID=3039283 RepID=UPI002A4E5A47|nr:phosphoribosylanthranilate isomerase [Chitinispirillales bacterium ANBcel5]